MTTSRERALGSAAVRIEGPAKVSGTARYAAEHTPPGCLYAWLVTATVARGRIESFDTAAALAEPGAVAVLTHENAPRIGEPDDPTLGALRDDRVPHRGWVVAVAVATSLEAARATADAVRVTYVTEDHDVVLTPTIPASTHPSWPTAGTPGPASAVTSTPLTPPPRSPSTSRTRWTRCTTTPWSRTPPSPTGRRGG